ncbi:hypothetical protein M501DRAFT_289634 [Patellaria atrata CBS 101060]|uniref:Uncharacterized protein n=1 Tax=Patellaria atrata CBS 101060 TaxID=1346257 RepID=A0A9P4S4N7_9PEZI|nr:hypothetical protein M501DRAFT_289634 [Patellaria atrata CBS 101060]
MVQCRNRIEPRGHLWRSSCSIEITQYQVEPTCPKPYRGPQLAPTNRVRWLLIYDNVDRADVLLRHWPVSERGHIILTTRKHTFAKQPAKRGLDMFETENAAISLLHLVQTERPYYSGRSKCRVTCSKSIYGRITWISAGAHAVSCIHHDPLHDYLKNVTGFPNTTPESPRGLNTGTTTCWIYYFNDGSLFVLYKISQ